MIMLKELRDTGQGAKGIISYLMDSIADGEGLEQAEMGATRYYTTGGTPPGRWLGSGLSGLGQGSLEQIQAGDVVTREQLERLIGHGQDPLTGEQLGRKYITPNLDERKNVIEEIKEMGKDDPDKAQAMMKELLQSRKEQAQGSVHAFDFTISPAKDVSVLWGLGDKGVREVIEAAHTYALEEAMREVENRALYTRTGQDGVNQVKTRGLIGARFDHWDSRAGDPHMHSHVVVANKVQGVEDGKWRTIDSRWGLFPAMVAISERYDSLLMDELTKRLGVQWDSKEHTRTGKPLYKIRGISSELEQEFSSRRMQIEKARTDQSRHGDQEAWKETRGAKKHRSLKSLIDTWRGRAAKIDPNFDAGRVLDFEHVKEPVLDYADAATDDNVHAFAVATLNELQSTRAHWTQWNVIAEAERQLRSLRLASGRGKLVDKVTARVNELSEQLNTTEEDSWGRKAAMIRYTTQPILDAEAALDASYNDFSSVKWDSARASRFLNTWKSSEGYNLSVSQKTAALEIAVSGRATEILVGPAGAGKTTTLEAITQLWRENGREVYGYAHAAAAAKVLSEATGNEANTLASWLVKCDRAEQAGEDRPHFAYGSLVIVDEAAMAGTLTLDRISRAAREDGAKLLLVGDHYQLGAIEAGGAFAMLAESNKAAPRLEEVRRFRNNWEETASLQLREGNLDVVAAYAVKERIRGGERDSILHGVLDAWDADRAEGKTTLMLAESNETASLLAEAARARRIDDGEVSPSVLDVRLYDGNMASVGDEIMTRQNQKYRIHPAVINGAVFTVAAINEDGSLAVTQPGKDTIITLPADYVENYVDLAYASTVHRAQGRTVDTCHTIITKDTAATALYVGMTRGRHSNTAWAITSELPNPDGPATQEDLHAIEIFARALDNRPDNRSATYLKNNTYTAGRVVTMRPLHTPPQPQQQSPTPSMDMDL